VKEITLLNVGWKNRRKQIFDMVGSRRYLM
jgi:hypothetical protein